MEDSVMTLDEPMIEPRQAPPSRYLWTADGWIRAMGRPPARASAPEAPVRALTRME